VGHCFGFWDIVKDSSEVSLKRQRSFPCVFPGLALAVGLSSAALAVAATPLPTTTQLTISPTTSVAAGTLLTLKVSVQSSGQDVSPGLVLFCNAAAAYCEDANILGQAQLAANGKGSLNLILPIGPHQIRAEFRGTTTYASSSSQTESVLVSGKYPTTTSWVSYAQTVDTYMMIGAVTTVGQVLPNGTLAFKDNANHQLPIADLPVGAPTLTLNPLAGLSGAGNFIAGPVADFNRDGKLDELAYDTSTSSWVVLFGNGDGTFVIGPSSKTAVGFFPSTIVTGDFNGDDIPDFAFADGNNIDIRLGLGNGKFSVPASIAIGQAVGFISVGDLNGDGNEDLIVSSGAGTQIWLGNGVGGFSLSPSPAFPAAVSPIQIADLNGDGLADFVYIDNVSGTTGGTAVIVYMGTPSGSFVATPTAIYCGTPCISTAVADFNGDGKPDLAVGENEEFVFGIEPAEIVLALGNGDGTFAHQTEIANGYLGQASLGDFNGDGKMDIASEVNVRDVMSSSILLGNGDGTFTASAGFSSPASAIGDFNNDGLSDLVGSPTAVGLAEEQYTATANGVTLTGPPGIHGVFANYEGDSHHAGSVSTSVPLQGPKVATVVTLDASPTPVVLGQTMRLVATVTPSVVDQDKATGTMTFSSGPNALGAAVPVVNGRAVFTTSTLPIGSNISLTAFYSGDTDFRSSQSQPVRLTAAGTLRPATSTVLRVSGAPAVPLGTVVTLSARVVNSGAPTSTGLVIFYSSTSAHPGETVIGQAQITPSGFATMRFRPPMGSLAFKAVYQGTNTHAGSASAPVSLSVTGTISTSTAVSVAPPGYSATVTANGPLAASGDVSFVDATDSNFVFATAPLSLSSTQLSLPAPIWMNLGGGPDGGFVADFNGDGILDIVTIATGVSSYELSILLGNRNGTFRQGFTGAVAGFPRDYTVADFNGDGIPDVAVLQDAGQQPSVAIFLGRADGTFLTPSTFPVALEPYAIAAGDFNDDGTPDLLITSYNDGTVTVVLGDGKGGFSAAPSFDQGYPGQGPALVGDFNGDGYPDVITANYNGFQANIMVFLGNGDGTFALNGFSVPCGEFGMTEADFNGDGTPDVLLSGCETDLELLLGNGNGTFAFWSLPVPPIGPAEDDFGAAAADLNGDGIPDLVVTNDFTPTAPMAILLGRGDGTFLAGPIFSPPGNPTPVPAATLLGDFNGDGIPDILETTNSGVLGPRLTPLAFEWSPSITQTSQAATNTTPPGTGTQQVYAAYSGDATHTGSTSSTVPATGSSEKRQQK